MTCTTRRRAPTGWSARPRRWSSSPFVRPTKPSPSRWPACSARRRQRTRRRTGHSPGGGFTGTSAIGKAASKLESALVATHLEACSAACRASMPAPWWPPSMTRRGPPHHGARRSGRATSTSATCWSTTKPTPCWRRRISHGERDVRTSEPMQPRGRSHRSSAAAAAGARWRRHRGYGPACRLRRRPTTTPIGPRRSAPRLPTQRCPTVTITDVFRLRTWPHRRCRSSTPTHRHGRRGRDAGQRRPPQPGDTTDLAERLRDDHAAQGGSRRRSRGRCAWGVRQHPPRRLRLHLPIFDRGPWAQQPPETRRPRRSPAQRGPRCATSLNLVYALESLSAESCQALVGRSTTPALRDEVMPIGVRLEGARRPPLAAAEPGRLRVGHRRCQRFGGHHGHHGPDGQYGCSHDGCCCHGRCPAADRHPAADRGSQPVRFAGPDHLVVGNGDENGVRLKLNLETPSLNNSLIYEGWPPGLTVSVTALDLPGVGESVVRRCRGVASIHVVESRDSLGWQRAGESQVRWRPRLRRARWTSTCRRWCTPDDAGAADLRQQVRTSLALLRLPVMARSRRPSNGQGARGPRLLVQPAVFGGPRSWRWPGASPRWRFGAGRQTGERRRWRWLSAGGVPLRHL